MSWRALIYEVPYRKVSKQSEGLEGFLRGDTVKVEASQDPGAKKGGLDRTVDLLGCYANFVKTSPYETRNTNLISLDVATKLKITNRFPNSMPDRSFF